MKMELNNIGLIENAEISIEGISIVAGHNGSGKSTIGKALFAAFNGFYNLNQKVNQIRLTSVRNLIDDFIDDNYSVDYVKQFDLSTKIAEEILNRKEHYEKNVDEVKNFILSTVSHLPVLPVEDEDGNTLDDEKDVHTEIVPTLQKLKKILSVTNLSIKEKILLDQFNEEFDRQVLNFNSPKKEGSVILTVKEKPSKILFSSEVIGGDLSVKLSGDTDLKHEVVYFDSPSILDDLDRSLSRVQKKSELSAFLNSSGRFRLGRGLGIPFKHNDILKNQLKRENPNNQIEESLANEEIAKVLSCLNQASLGRLAQKDGKYSYSINGNNVNIGNVSSGLKTFIAIKQLLTQGVLKEKGMIILDEPEVHLHPEWQILFAQIIVLLQKTFDINFLINTHSPYFMEAIEVFSSKFDILSKLKCYMSSRNEHGIAIIEDVSNCIEKAYGHLARPFQDLENIRHSDDI